MTRKRVLLGAAGLAVIVITFAFFLPKIADYRDVWDVVQTLSWQWIVALLVVTAVNIATFAPPWQVALPGLRFLRALEVTQASTALSIVFPAGIAAGMASSYAVLRTWGFKPRDIARAL